MSTNLITAGDGRQTDLAELAAQINTAHDATLTSARTTLDHARRAGELLNEAKGMLGHGKWLPWLKANVSFSAATAQRYMRVASRWDELANTSSVTHLTEATALLAEPKPEKQTDTLPDWPPAYTPEFDRTMVHIAFGGRGDFAEIIPHEQEGFCYAAIYRWSTSGNSKDGGGIVDYMKRGIAWHAVGWFLGFHRFKPDVDGWYSKPHDGETPLYINADRADQAKGIWR